MISRKAGALRNPAASRRLGCPGAACQPVCGRHRRGPASPFSLVSTANGRLLSDLDSLKRFRHPLSSIAHRGGIGGASLTTVMFARDLGERWEHRQDRTAASVTRALPDHDHRPTHQRYRPVGRRRPMSCPTGRVSVRQHGGCCRRRDRRLWKKPDRSNTRPPQRGCGNNGQGLCGHRYHAVEA